MRAGVGGLRCACQAPAICAEEGHLGVGWGERAGHVGWVQLSGRNCLLRRRGLPRRQNCHGHLATAGQEVKQPAVAVKKSITPDFLICLEDGRKFKSLKRHLRTKYDMSPEQYRAKWGLPKDYPMVAPNYAAARSNLAKQSGLGQGGRKPSAKTAKARVAK